LLSYNLEHLEDKNPKDLGVYVKDATGNIVAGLIRNTHGNWLTVKFLWVSDSLRGKKSAAKYFNKRSAQQKNADASSFFWIPSASKLLYFTENMDIRKHLC
jgi:hypothetical protein